MNPAIFKPSHESQSQTSSPYARQPQSPSYRRGIAQSVRMHPVLAACVGIAVFALMAAYALTRRPYYETSALVYVQPMKARVVTDPADGSYDPIRYDSYIQQQMQTILRSDTLTDALNDAAKADVYDEWALPGETVQSAVARLQKNLKVERETGSYQLSISLSGNNPEEITTLVNAVVDNYIKKERADELAQSDQQLQLLRQDRVRILNALNNSTEEQARLGTSLGVADPAGGAGNPASSGSSVNPFDTQLAELRAQLDEAHAARVIADAQLASVTGSSVGSSNSLNAAAEDSVSSDPGLGALKQTISQRRSTLATQMAGLTPKNPLYKQDQDELKRLDDSLESMSSELRAKAGQQVLAKLQLDATRKEDVEARLAAQLQQATLAATKATPKLQRASFLAVDVARLQARFTEVDNAINTLELEHNSSGLVHLLLPAEFPAKPQTSRKWLVLAAALPFGIGFGLWAALMRHKMDPLIYIGKDIVSVLNFPPMAVLPNPKDVEQDVVDEFMLRLVAGVDQAHSSGGARTYLFSAISPSTNITDLVAGLAQKMERLGYRTLILKASAALHSPASPEEEAAKARRELQLAPLTQARHTEMRRSSVIAENLEKLTQKVDLLFLEALPLMSSGEAEFAARLADITVLVAESATTTRSELAHSMELVRRLNVPGVAAVLSNVHLRHADSEFLSMVHSVEKRRSERKRREKAPARTSSEAYPRSILKNQSAVPYDRETPAQP